MKRLFFICLLCCSQLLLAQNSPTVLSILEAVAQNNPQSPAAYLDLGQHYFFNQQFAQANQQFDKAIALDADNADFYFFQAAAYEAQGMLEEALNNYDKAIGYQSATEYLIRRVQIRYKLKKYAGAAADCREILETYETMADIKKILADCEKNGGSADKPVEPNTAAKITPTKGDIFLDQFIKSFERFSDTGDLYRALLFFFTNNLDKATPVFEKVIAKDNDTEALYYCGIIQEIKGNGAEATKYYEKALLQINRELVESKFEDLAGYKEAKEEIARLQQTKTDYLFRQHAVTTAAGKMPDLPVAPEKDEMVRGEVRAAKTTYSFEVEKQDESNGQRNIYKLSVKEKMGNTIMLVRLVAEKQGNAIIIKITHGGKKDPNSLSWVNYPQDILVAQFVPSGKAKYKFEGSRLTAEKKASIKMEDLEALYPVTLNFTEAVAYAARSYMVTFIIKE